MSKLDVTALRKRMNWSQGMLADYLGVTQPTVARIESGQEPSGPVLKLLELLDAPDPYELAKGVHPNDIHCVFNLSEDEMKLWRRFRALDRAVGLCE